MAETILIRQMAEAARGPQGWCLHEWVVAPAAWFPGENGRDGSPIRFCAVCGAAETQLIEDED